MQVDTGGDTLQVSLPRLGLIPASLAQPHKPSSHMGCYGPSKTFRVPRLLQGKTGLSGPHVAGQCPLLSAPHSTGLDCPWPSKRSVLTRHNFPPRCPLTCAAPTRLPEASSP